MADQDSAEQKLARLRELVLHARSMPMSASCVINRSEVLEAIDDVVKRLPDEFAEAQRVIDESQAKVAEGEAEADRIINEARGKVAQIKADAETEAAALRRETDVFIDSRMASFESVLHKTSSQVKTARIRLSERSSLDKSR